MTSESLPIGFTVYWGAGEEEGQRLEEEGGQEIHQGESTAGGGGIKNWESGTGE